MRNINKLERLQERFCKFLDNGRRDKVSLLKENNILPFKNVYKYFTMVKLYKCINLGQHRYFHSIINDFIPEHNHNTRFVAHNNFNIPNIRLTRCRKSFIYNAICIWNLLPLELKNVLTLVEFKMLLKRYYLIS